jgi:hypothetical protein
VAVTSLANTTFGKPNFQRVLTGFSLENMGNVQRFGDGSSNDRTDGLFLGFKYIAPILLDRFTWRSELGGFFTDYKLSSELKGRPGQAARPVLADGSGETQSPCALPTPLMRIGLTIYERGSIIITGNQSLGLGREVRR